MNTNSALESETLDDVPLVDLSLRGDREAFGEIVARYQSAICGVAFSACGDVARSEDIAQEIFITAWRKLGTLRDPAKFRAWLFGIARNRIHNVFRQNARDPVAGAQLLEQEVEVHFSGNQPDERAISKEEELILWRLLSKLPDIYREPMVLFYRENESVRRVADALSISEDTVRQRLCRGRALLSDGVTKLLREGLRCSAPADVFTAGVIAVLPILAAATAAQGAVVGVATTKSATSHATGFGILKGLGVFAALIAIPATLGGYFGQRLSRDSDGFTEQRKSVEAFWRFFGVGIVVCLFLPLLLTFGITGFLRGENRATFLSIMKWWLVSAYFLVPGLLVVWSIQRRRKPADDAESERIVGGVSGGAIRKISPRLVFLLTVAAAALFTFCFLDTNHATRIFVSPAELREAIGQNDPKQLQASVTESHNRSLFGESPEVTRSLRIVVGEGRKRIIYFAGADEETSALLKEKGIECPTYVQGRDFEVLGTPGRLLPILAAFVLAVGGVFLVKPLVKVPIKRI
jgi:RNA polymerase sigma factor (sigma-70 family)